MPPKVRDVEEMSEPAIESTLKMLGLTGMEVDESCGWLNLLLSRLLLAQLHDDPALLERAISQLESTASASAAPYLVPHIHNNEIYVLSKYPMACRGILRYQGLK